MSLKRDLAERIKGFALRDYNFVVTADPVVFKYLQGMQIPELGKYKIHLLRVHSMDDLKFLNEEDMAKFGWYKKKESDND